MERQLPKNVRQIGNVSDTPKVYVEDYVDTFFIQLCEKVEQEPIGAFLVGDMQTSDGEDYVYIYGAIQMHDLKMNGTDFVVDDDVWKKAYEDCKQYFEDGEMLGWFVAQPGASMVVSSSTAKLHKKSFPKKNSIFIIKDSLEKEETYFVHKFNDLMEIGGHYTYYEKNPSMQNYMISARKKNGVTPSETVEDRAAKDFRSLVRTREEQNDQRRASRMMYATSVLLVLIVVVMGVATINNFDKMKSVQNTLQNISSTVQGDGKTTDDTAKSQSEAEPEVQETSGNVVAVTGEDANAAQPDIVAQEQENDGQADEKNTGETINQEDANKNGSDGVYIVEEGDTLAIISRKAYGDVSHVDAICKMNGLTDGNLIYIGQKLVLP